MHIDVCTQDIGSVRQSDGANAAHFAAVGGDGDTVAALRTLAWLDQRGHVDLGTATLAGQTALDLYATPQWLVCLFWLHLCTIWATVLLLPG